MKYFKIFTKAGLAIVFTYCSATVAAQKTPQQLEEIRTKILSDTKVKSVIIDEERQTPSLIVMNRENGAYKSADAASVLSNLVGVRKDVDALVQDRQSVMGNGATVLEFQQYYRGVKVDRSKVKAYIQDGEVRFYNGSFYNVPEQLKVAPSITKERAIAFAKQKVNASKYADEAIRERMQGHTDSKKLAMLQAELEEATPRPELVVIKDFNKKGIAEMHLAYKMNMYAAVPLSRAWVYVDANDGTILLVDKIIKHVSEPAPPPSVLTTVQTRYAGTRNIYVNQISGNDPQSGQLLTSSHPTTEVYTPGSLTWVLMDDTRGGGIETYDLNGVGGLPISVAPAYAIGKSFTDVNNQWTLAEHKRSAVEGGAAEAENDDIAWDAHWGAEVVYDYWKAKHNRLSYDGNNAKIKSFIHSGIAYDNAFWNGSVMTYGDGSGPDALGFKPLTSLDVCGHEIGHGVCTFTSDLVYANESGAMNEGFSDIWAACVEYFAIKTVDPTLASVYKPFYIGEQISADPNSPLRRMDKPSAQGNPDTYGGENWVSQTGCSPTLANDQCGVHTNSGVLNKWFYLLTVGSGTGSGPDAAFAGEDDGINDAVTTGPAELQHPANPYSVSGLGFTQAEQITFIMETMLTSTATFAEARQVSIAIATDISGSPCSNLVQTVTNAWYAVGVGPKFVTPCTITYGFVNTNVIGASETAPIIGCASSKVINVSFIMPPNSAANISVGGNAIRNADYFISTATVTNNTSVIAKKILPVTIINDGNIEGDENLLITLTISNTGSNPVNRNFTLKILDDDVAPVLGNVAKQLLAQYFTRGDGFNEVTGWTEIFEIPEAPNGDPLAFGKNQWGVFGNRLTITGKDGVTGAAYPAGNYNNVSESQTLVRTPLIDAGGVSTVSIRFDYTVQGEIDPLTLDPENFPAFDYMAVAYSLDGVNFVELAGGEFRQFASAAPTSGTLIAPLPASLANKKFYLGFRWHNDGNAGGPQSVSIDNLVVSGTPRRLENQLSHNARNIMSSGVDAFFISVQDGEVLGRIKNNSTSDFGCTNMFIERTGNSIFNLYGATNSTVRVSQKVFRINPNNNITASNYVVLYYSEAQLAALEAATGRPRNTFSLFFVNASGYTAATPANTTQYPLVYTAVPGVGGFYTSGLLNRLGGSFALGVNSTSARPYVSTQEKMASSEWTFTNAYPNPVKDNLSMIATTPVKQKASVTVMAFEGKIVKTQAYDFTAGTNKINVNMQGLPAGTYIVQVMDAAGTILKKETVVKE